MMNIPVQSTRPPPRSPVEPEDAAVTDENGSANPGRSDRTVVDDQGAYEAALSEGWPVPPQPGRHGRMTAGA